MQKKLAVALFTTIGLLSPFLAGCAHISNAGLAVKERLTLPENEIAAPVGPMKLFRSPDASMEQLVADEVRSAVFDLIYDVDPRLSRTSPITVLPFKNLNPEIISTSQFAQDAADQVATTLTSDGFLAHKTISITHFAETNTAIGGTYLRAGKSLIVTVKLYAKNSLEVLGEREFTVVIDAGLRKQLDR